MTLNYVTVSRQIVFVKQLSDLPNPAVLSSAVHLKIFPSEAGADGIYKTLVSPQRNIATNIQHIFLSLSFAGSYHLAGAGGVQGETGILERA